jgi:hypothetical protein
MAERRPSTFAPGKSPGESAFKETLKVSARRVTGGWGATVAVGNEFEGLRLRNSHATSQHTQAMGAWLNFDDGSDDVALFTPQLEETTAVRLGYGVTCEAHVEEDAAVFEQRCGGVRGKVFFEDLGEFGSGKRVGSGGQRNLPVLPRA